MRRIFIIILTLLLLSGTVSAADISIPVLELVTRGWVDSGLFKVSTRGNMEMNIEGGYKFGGRILFGIDSNNLLSVDSSLSDIEAPLVTDVITYLENQASINFKLASVVIRDIFTLPFNLTFFTGQFDIFCNGDFFPEYFGSYPIKTNFGGYMDFPDGIRYDGIHKVNGTGFKFTSSLGTDWNFTSLYIYQDSYLGTGRYSTDLRTMFNFDFFKAEAFIGAAFPISTMGYYKAGLLLYLNRRISDTDRDSQMGSCE